jgi:hypothetical protein
MNLLEDFKKINKNVVQVLVFPVKFNESYVAKVYLRSEQDGKDFIVDYPSKRKEIYKYFLDNIFTFNINVDLKVLKRIKAAR